MAKNEKQKSKLLALARLFLMHTDSEHGLTLKEILCALENDGIKAERKSLYDDFAVLSECGMPIEKRGNGQSVTYRLTERRFQVAELKLLVDAVQSAKFLSERTARSLIGKLSELVSIHEAGALKREIYISDRLCTESEAIYDAVDTVHTAIAENVKVSFLYFNYDEKKCKQYRRGGSRYLVSPWGLIWSDGNYYMIAYDSEEQLLKHYRVDKMEAAVLSDAIRDGRALGEALDLSVYAKKIFGMYHGEETLVVLRVENALAGVILDRFGHEPTFVPVDPDHFEVRVRVSVSPQFLGWIMSFGRAIRIVGPDEVVREYRKLAAEILAP